MMLLLAGGLALWLLAVLIVLSICRAAARADEREAGRRLVEAGRRGVGVGLAAAAVSLAAHAPPAQARPARSRAPTATSPTRPIPRWCATRCCARSTASATAATLRRLRLDAQLDLAAGRHATDMFERRYFSHTSPGGGDLGDRARRAGYAKRTCSWRVGEVLAWGVAAAQHRRGDRRGLARQPGRTGASSSRGATSELGVGTVAGTPVRAVSRPASRSPPCSAQRHCST